MRLWRPPNARKTPTVCDWQRFFQRWVSGFILLSITLCVVSYKRTRSHQELAPRVRAVGAASFFHSCQSYNVDGWDSDALRTRANYTRNERVTVIPASTTKTLALACLFCLPLSGCLFAFLSTTRRLSRFLFTIEHAFTKIGNLSAAFYNLPVSRTLSPRPCGRLDQKSFFRISRRRTGHRQQEKANCWTHRKNISTTELNWTDRDAVSQSTRLSDRIASLSRLLAVDNVFAFSKSPKRHQQRNRTELNWQRRTQSEHSIITSHPSANYLLLTMFLLFQRVSNATNNGTDLNWQKAVSQSSTRLWHRIGQQTTVLAEWQCFCFFKKSETLPTLTTEQSRTELSEHWIIASHLSADCSFLE